MLVVEDCERHYIFAVRIFQEPTAANLVSHTPSIETAIFFRRSGATSEELVGHINYGDHRKIATNHSCRTNVVKNVRRGSPEKRPSSGLTDS